jgi:CelD/BcsL family acetyltransferase involved in cellulose biosynthesis
MHITRITESAQLSSLKDQWDALAGDAPFLGWDWCATWWKHYGARGRLFVLCVRDEGGAVRGIAPWYVERQAARGRVVRFLGSGEVCSDYQTILCRPEDISCVTSALADWLVASQRTASGENGTRDRDAWDLIELSNVPADDAALVALKQELQHRACDVHTRPALNCWRLELPGDFETYVERLSKNHRKLVRRIVTRQYETGRCRFDVVRDEADFDATFDLFVELHQKRWRGQGEAGAFASPRFTAFHREMARTLLRQGRLRLHRVSVEGRPLAVDYFIAAGSVLYGYQGGVDPDCLDEQPGNLATVGMLKTAIAEGFTTVDFLRGDEPYKPHFRAEPRPCEDVEIVPPRLTSRLRNGAWQAAKTVKKWLVASG